MTDRMTTVPADELAEMRRELAALRAEVGELRGADVDSRERDVRERSKVTSSRRTLLTKGGLAAAAGLAGAAALSRPAAAADGENVVQGQTNNATSTTTINATAANADGVQGTSQATTGFGAGVAGFGSSDAGYGVFGSGPGRGVGGTTTEPTGSGVVGFNNQGSGNGAGVVALSTSPDGRGVFAENLATSGEAIALAAQSAQSSSGLGVVGVGGAIGGAFTGATAGIRLDPSGADPRTESNAVRGGEIYYDNDGNLWLCTEAGTPGTWEQLNVAAPTIPPVLTPFSPFRVYDSRFDDGPLAAGENRTVSVKDQIDVTTGATIKTDSVPPGTSAIACNVTVTGTLGGGFVAITPATATTFAASTVNWSTNGSDIANSTFTTLDAMSQVKLFCGGGPGTRTDIVIDIVGTIA